MSSLEALMAYFLSTSPHVERVFRFENHLIVETDNRRVADFYERIALFASERRRLAVADHLLETEDYPGWETAADAGYCLPKVWLVPLDWQANPSRIGAKIDELGFPTEAYVEAQKFDAVSGDFVAVAVDELPVEGVVLITKCPGSDHNALRIAGRVDPAQVLCLARQAHALYREGNKVLIAADISSQPGTTKGYLQHELVAAIEAQSLPALA